MASTLKIVGRLASPRPAGPELAHLGPPFHGLTDQHVYEVHGDAPVQKISARQDVFGKGAGSAGLYPLHNMSLELVICITFASGLRIG